MVIHGWRNAIPDLSRRSVLVLAGLAVSAAGPENLAWEFSFPAIDGGDLKFLSFKGRVLLVVNTASFCGYTYQYESLQKLHAAQSANGLTVIGVPSGDFRQESADNATVKTFCDAMYGIDFPMSGIQHVKGTSAVPFYAWVRAVNGWEPGWNFNKVLIGRDGRIKATFGSGDEPQGPKITQAIAAELAAK